MITPLEAARLLADDYVDRCQGVVDTLAVRYVYASIVEAAGARVLLIRGTTKWQQWGRYNLRLWPKVEAGDRLLWHGGFLRAAQVVYAFAKGKRIDLVTGHSLGAAVTQIVATSLGVRGYGFASPRPLWGCRQPAGAVLMTSWNRRDDLVTALPPAWLGFRHVGGVVWLDPPERHRGEDHGIAHYLELLGKNG